MKAFGPIDENVQQQMAAFHAGTVRVLHTLTPIGVAMAGRDEFDPYKD